MRHTYTTFMADKQKVSVAQIPQKKYQELATGKNHKARKNLADKIRHKIWSQEEFEELKVMAGVVLD